VFVVPGSFGWNDVGDWKAVYEESQRRGLDDEQGNVVPDEAKAILHNSSRCLVHSDDRLVVLVGMHDTVVVDTDDAILVCDRENAQHVKNIVDYLHSHQLDEYV
jgi:mannose-1-phosphate guanylyltransferase